MVFPVIIFDTSFLVSFYHTGDSNHAKAMEIATSLENEEKMLPDTILFETITVLIYRAGMETAKNAYFELTSDPKTGFLHFDRQEREEIITELLERHDKLSSADMSVAYLARKMGAKILSFDRNLNKAVGKKAIT